MVEHDLLGVSYLDLYKGGAGFKAVEFKFINNEFEGSGDIATRNHDLQHGLKRSLQHCDDYYQYLSPNDAYLDGIQSGFIGPIVSFWSRLYDTDSLIF